MIKKWHKKILVGGFIGLIISIPSQVVMQFIYLVLFEHYPFYFPKLIISIFINCIIGAFISMAYGHYLSWVKFAGFGSILTTSIISSYTLYELEIFWLIGSFIIIFLSGILGILIALEEEDETLFKKYSEEEINNMQFNKKSSNSFNKNYNLTDAIGFRLVGNKNNPINFQTGLDKIPYSNLNDSD